MTIETLHKKEVPEGVENVVEGVGSAIRRRANWRSINVEKIKREKVW